MFPQGGFSLCCVILKGRTACSLMFSLARGLERIQAGFEENVFLGQLVFSTVFIKIPPKNMAMSPPKSEVGDISEGYVPLSPRYYEVIRPNRHGHLEMFFILHLLFPEANHYRPLKCKTFLKNHKLVSGLLGYLAVIPYTEVLKYSFPNSQAQISPECGVLFYFLISITQL